MKRLRIAPLGALLGGLALCAGAQTRPTGRMHLQPRQTHYYVGQTVQWQIELEVSDGELGGSVHLENLPRDDAIRLGPFEEQPDQTRVEDGQLVTLKRFSTTLTFLREGDVALAPTLRGMIARRSRRGSASVWTHTSFQTPLRGLTLTIQPLPQPAPPEFSGAIGQFRLQVDPPPQEASPGDLINLNWRLEGFGALDAFQAPAYSGHSALRVYPARIEIVDPVRRVDVARVVVPLGTSVPELPAVDVSVFDPVLGRYRTLSAGPYPLRLTPRKDAAPPEITEPPEWPPPSRTGDPEAVPPPLEIASHTTACHRWIGTLGALLAIAVGAARRRRGRSLRRALCSAFAIALATLLLRWLVPHESRATLTLSTPVETRLAPSSKARRLGDLPAGLTVVVLERSGDWVRIKHQGASGWIPLTAHRSLDSGTRSGLSSPP